MTLRGRQNNTILAVVLERQCMFLLGQGSLYTLFCMFIKYHVPCSRAICCMFNEIGSYWTGRFFQVTANTKWLDNHMLYLLPTPVLLSSIVLVLTQSTSSSYRESIFRCILKHWLLTVMFFLEIIITFTFGCLHFNFPANPTARAVQGERKARSQMTLQSALLPVLKVVIWHST